MSPDVVAGWLLVVGSVVVTIAATIHHIKTPAPDASLGKVVSGAGTIRQSRE